MTKEDELKKRRELRRQNMKKRLEKSGVDSGCGCAKRKRAVKKNK